MAIVKWNLPPEPPPTWLDPTLEIKDDTEEIKVLKSLSSKERSFEFVKICFYNCRSLGLTNWQALHVTANMVLETGWGQAFKAYNIGGVKITRPQVEEALKKGKKLSWYRAPGNKSSGDPPWCYYRAYSSFAEFIAEWVEKFVPKNPGPNHRYKLTGPKFWKEDRNWFMELIRAGYKGEVTKANPTPSFNNHLTLVTKCMTMMVQFHLGIDTDGVDGPKTQQFVSRYQDENGFARTGVITFTLFNYIFPMQG